MFLKNEVLGGDSRFRKANIEGIIIGV